MASTSTDPSLHEAQSHNNALLTRANSSTCLLRLPQEIKDQIYELSLGGELIHVIPDLGTGRHHTVNKAPLCTPSGDYTRTVFDDKIGAEWDKPPAGQIHKTCYPNDISLGLPLLQCSGGSTSSFVLKHLLV